MDARNANPSAPRQRLSTDERQREIVATVLALARERGPEAITTQAIADRMGVTQGALFRHFPDKEAIWLAVFAWVRESLGAVFAAAVADGATPLGKIERHSSRTWPSSRRIPASPASCSTSCSTRAIHRYAPKCAR